MPTVILYIKESCPLCDDAKLMLETLQDKYSYHIEIRDVYTDDDWLEQYHLLIPCIEINGKTLDASQLDWHTLEQFVQRYLSR
ncbi:glutaredoxin family protein [Cerasibacillus sp. JNUCC 74]